MCCSLLFQLTSEQHRTMCTDKHLYCAFLRIVAVLLCSTIIMCFAEPVNTLTNEKSAD